MSMTTETDIIATERPAFERGDVSQDSQYDFPYHYIPSFKNGHFSQHLYWSWGFRYLGAMEFIFSILSGQPFESLVDIGCGDGRFLREVDARFPGKELSGIDCSARAINLARAMNPRLNFECLNICEQPLAVQFFDVITLIEVLEHIPIESAESFVEATTRYLKNSGRLLFTVPHKNVPVSAKHHQHFGSESLTKILSPHYEITRLEFIDKRARIFNRIMNSLLQNRLFILNNRKLLDTLFRIYYKHFFVCSEKRCARLFVEARKR